MEPSAPFLLAFRYGVPVEGFEVAAKAIQPDEAAVRNRVLNEVLDAFSDMDDTAGIEGVLKVIQSLKKKQKATADQA